MTLSACLDIVKRHRATIGIAVGTAACALALASWLHDDGQIYAEVRSEFGETTVQSMAYQAMEAILQPDTLHLSVLANRATTLEAVTRARFIGINGEQITASGDVRSRAGAQVFRAEIVINSTVAGYAEIEVDGNAFTPVVPTYQRAVPWLMVVLLPLLAVALLDISRRRRPAVPIVELPSEIEELERDQPRTIVVGNLYNQLAFTAPIRQRLSQTAINHAEKVARLYQARVQSLSGGGLMIQFDSAQDDDEVFHAVCASIVLSDVLATVEPDAEYRFAMHRLVLPRQAEPNAEVIADVTLLAALARERCLLATPAAYAGLQNPTHVTTEEFLHPMLEDVQIVADTAHLMTGVADDHQRLLNQQYTLLSDYDASTPRESTR